MLRSAALAFGLALAAAGSASAELVARGVQDGALALGPKGTPYVAFVRSGKVVVAQRRAKRWRSETAAAVGSGWQVRAFAVGRAGPVVLVQSPDTRRIMAVRRVLLGWQTIRLAARLPAGTLLGWPGLALDRAGNPIVAYVRWRPATFASRLILARVNAGGRVRAQRITAGGFPPGYLAPTAEPLLVGAQVHVLESSGWRGSVETFEWYPRAKTWTGLGVDVSRGDWPLGPVLAQAKNGLVYAAWTESMLGFGFVPVTLAVHRLHSVSVHSEFVLDRALTTALALPASGPEVAANEWVDQSDLGLDGGADVWAGVVKGAGRVELDGWIAGLTAPASGGRDLLLARPEGLSWFHARRRLTTSVTIDAAPTAGGVTVNGTVGGVSSGTVRIYREHPGTARQLAGSASIVGGSYSFLDRAPVEPLLYRAVYTDPSSGIPFAALLHPLD